jgi:flagellin
VQTAEGALTEVHSMLNRMYDLAEQAANGTFEGLDRDQLQKEVSQLRTEINRIADSSNFNGIKLLDGSLAGGGSGGVSSYATVKSTTQVKDAYSISTGQKLEMTATFATIESNAIKAGDTMNVTIDLSDGTHLSIDLDIVTSSGGTGADLKLADGTKLQKNLASSIKATDTEVAAIVAELAKKNEEIVSKLDVAYTAGNKNVQFKGYDTASFDTPKVTNISVSAGKSYQNPSVAIDKDKEGYGVYQTLNWTKLKLYDAASTTVKKEDAIFTVNGLQFAFAKDNASAQALGSEVYCIVTTTALGSMSSTMAKDMVALINKQTGLDMSHLAPNTSTFTKTKFVLLTRTGGGASGGGLTLQIGDTGAAYNKLNVSIENMHASAMGISGIDISTQGGAASALDSIKKAINYVSETRGTLGATQNRLEHTINNLSVMQENIQDAESTIRDTDVAAEMMKYTKSSILVQSAQAMLAQANKQPQGVLQLLQ